MLFFCAHCWYRPWILLIEDAIAPSSLSNFEFMDILLWFSRKNLALTGIKRLITLTGSREKAEITVIFRVFTLP
jgi:hypothetical protein